MWLTFEIGSEELIDTIPGHLPGPFLSPREDHPQGPYMDRGPHLEAILKYKERLFLLTTFTASLTLLRYRRQLALGATVQTLKTHGRQVRRDCVPHRAHDEDEKRHGAWSRASGTLPLSNKSGPCLVHVAIQDPLPQLRQGREKTGQRSQ